MLACPRSPRFQTIVRDSGGLDAGSQWNIKQDIRAGMPLYVPMIQHGSVRREHVELPLVALKTFEVTRRRGGNGKMFETAEELRSFFRIGAKTRLILISADQDTELERYWELSRVDSLPERLAGFGIELISAPNFSFPLNVPRFEHLANRRRSLICAEEFSGVGMNVVPHLNAVTQGDWDFWRDFLREHTHVKVVAKEFQTGGATRRVAQWHVDQLLRIEDALGRGLHLIAVAGRRHLWMLTTLSGFTIIDSVPFMKTVYRQRLSHKDGQWKINRTLPGQPLDELLKANIAEYSRVLFENATKLKQYSLSLGNHTFGRLSIGLDESELPTAEWAPAPEQMTFDYV